MMLVLDTSTGANFAVYAPPSPKIYVVRNASSYTATIYNSTIAGNTTAAGTGVAVSAGNTAFVYTDGTNFRTLSVDELSGTLLVTNGGTGLTTLTANNVILGNGTSTPQFVAPGTVGNVLVSDGTTWTSGVGVPTGSLFMWPTGTAPTGYLLCDGTTYNEGDYLALFGVIGRTFGGDAGASTFSVPDYRDRMPVGAGTTYSVADTGGSTDAVVVEHNHTTTVNDPGHSHTYSRPINQLSYDPGANAFTALTTDNTSVSTTGITVGVNNEGVSGTGANLPPYLAIYFIIKI
jgi:microcystin-dependent protein